MKVTSLGKYIGRVFTMLCMALFLPNTSTAIIYLDPSFGSNHNGYELITNDVTTAIYKAGIQADGKIVFAGYTSDGSVPSFFTTRYSDAGIDATFGTQGKVVQQLGSYSVAFSTAIQTDGKIVVAGYANVADVNNIAITRYLSNGSPDTGFGDNGVVLTTGESGYYADDMVLQSDGKIVVVGSASASQVETLAARYTSDGVPDTGFGSDGVTLTVIGSQASSTQVVMQADSKILTSGYAIIDGIPHGVLARYDSAGSLDMDGFNPLEGYLTQLVPDASSTEMFGCALQSNGKSIALLHATIGDLSGVCFLARYNTDGTLDTSFGTDGFAGIDEGNMKHGSAIAIDANDKIVVVGYMLENESDYSAFIARYLADGSGLDTTFGDQGTIIAEIGSNLMATFVTIQADGRIIVTGVNTDETASFVARYFPSSDEDFVGVVSPGDGTTITNASFPLWGYASEPNMNVVVKLDDASLITVTSDANGYWNAGSYITTNGTHTITAELWDGSTQLATTTNTITVTLTTDAIVVTSPVDGSSITTANPAVYGGSSRASTPVYISLDGSQVATVTTDSRGVWTIGQALMLGNGEREITADLMDGSSIVATTTNTFNVTSTVPPIYWGNTIRVDAKFGSDLTCRKTTLSSPFDMPCLTVEKALSIAQPGDQVLVFPGVYDEADLTLPTGTSSSPVAIRGMDPKTTIIQKTSATADTDLITMGEYSSLSDVTLKLGSDEHHILRGIVFPGTTTETASIKNVELYVDNSAASAESSSNVYGVHSIGTGRPDVTQQAIQSSKIQVASNGDGDKRALLIDAANTINSRESAFSVTCPQGDCTGSYVGVETNAPSAIADIRRSDIEGYVGGATGYTGMSLSADVAQTAGTMNIDLCSLTNANAAGLGFNGAHQSFMFWGIDGLLPNTSPRYVRFGSGSTLDSIISLAMHKLTLVKSLRVQLVTPSSSSALTFMVLKNGEDTNLFVTVPATETLGLSSNVSVTFNAGDAIALKLISEGAAGGASNAIISVETY